MTRHDHSSPGWRAMEVGPGGVPAGDLRPVRAEVERPHGAGAGGAGRGPSAVFGDFDFAPPETGWHIDPAARISGPSRGAVLGWLALAVGVAVLVAALLWSDPGQTHGQTSGALAPGSCLTSSSGRSVVVVDCADPGVEFTVAASYPGTTDGARCDEVSSDLMLLTRDQVVLCLNYRAAVGDCLYAGHARDIGKAPCRIPGSASTPPGLFRVVAVLPHTLDVRGCPTGTVSSLVHATIPEVLCLGLP